MNERWLAAPKSRPGRHRSSIDPGRVRPRSRTTWVCGSGHRVAWIHSITQQPCAPAAVDRSKKDKKGQRHYSLVERVESLCRLTRRLPMYQCSFLDSQHDQSTHAAHHRSHGPPHHIHRQLLRPVVQLERPPGVIKSIQAGVQTLERSSYLSLLHTYTCGGYTASRGTCVYT